NCGQLRIEDDYYTVLAYLDDLKDQAILDIGCGDGNYCRLFKAKGAKKVMGVDVSPHMIKFAEEIEIANPLGCEYKVVDAETEQKAVGQFDIAVTAFVLVYADTAQRLSKFCNFIYKNLKPGGTSINLIRNCFSTKFWGNSLEKYGRKFTMLDKTEDGGFGCTVHLPLTDNEEFTVTNYVLRPSTYEKCFLDAGFSTFQFKPCQTEMNKKSEEYWKEVNENPHQIVIIATK
uniref:Methyltransferase domain-containing protein n=1 Tax=Strigamia maritima TaxID=126957 RepID=T1JCB5_STRMM